MWTGTAILVECRVIRIGVLITRKEGSLLEKQEPFWNMATRLADLEGSYRNGQLPIHQN